MITATPQHLSFLSCFFFYCFADLEFSSSVHISKVTKKFRMSYSNSVKCQAILLELVLSYFAMNEIFVQFYDTGLSDAV